MHSPFFFKQNFYLPTETNAANVKYIATRPGADRGDLEPETPASERDPKEISLDNALGPVEPGTAVGHVKYMSERLGSHGLFDADGAANLEAAMDEIKCSKSIVWRDVVSLHEDDAARLGYTIREAWEDALRRSVPDVARAMGIREGNLRWVAAFHQKAGHPHCHISFWEQNPERTRGVVSKGERRDMRKAFMDIICENERATLSQSTFDNAYQVVRGEYSNLGATDQVAKGPDLLMSLKRRIEEKYRGKPRRFQAIATNQP